MSICFPLLELTGANKGLEQVAAQADSIDLKNISSSVESLSDRFSTMGIVGMTAIQNITNSVFDLGKKAASTVFNLIKQGGITRALNIEQAKFQIEGLGSSWEALEKQINYGVQDTAYGLDSAAKAAAQLLASGVKFDKSFDTKKPDQMAKTLRAISGVAAMTGREYDNIANIFTTVAGNGRLMGVQLTQMSYAGLNAAATLRDYFNSSSELMDVFYKKYTSTAKKNDKVIKKGAKATEEDIRTMVTNGAIDFNTFASAMDSAFGEHAKDANKTFEGALSNIKAALSRIGAKFATPGLENLRKIFVELIPVINGFSAALDPMVDFVSKRMKDISGAVIKFLGNIKFDVFTKNIESFAKKAEKIVTDIKNTLSFKNDNLATRGLKYISVVFSGIFKRLGKDVKTFFSLFKTNRNITQIISPIVQRFAELVHAVSVIQEKLSTFFRILASNETLITGIKNTIGGVISVFRILWEIVNSFFNILGKEKKTFDSVFETVSSILGFIFNYTGKIGKYISALSDYFTENQSIYKLFVKIKDTLSVVGEPIINFMGRIKKAFNDLFSSSDSKNTDKKIEKVENASEKIGNVLDKIKNKLENFVKYIRLIGSKLKTAFTPIIKNFKEAFKNLNIEKIIRSFNLGMIGAILTKLFKLLDARRWKEVNGFRGLGDNIASFLKQMENCFTEFQKKMKEERFRKIAVSIAILAGALFVMSLIDGKKLAATMGVMSAMFGELFGMMAGLGVLNKQSSIAFTGIERLTTSMLKIAASMLIMAEAVRIIGKLDPGQAAVGVASIGALLTEIYFFMKKLSKGNLDKETKSLIGVSAAILIMGEAVRMIGKLDPGQALVGVSGIGILLALIAGFMTKLKDIDKEVPALMGLSAAMLILAGAMRIIGTMDPTQALQGVVAIGGLLTLIAAFMRNLKDVNKEVPALIGLSAAMLILAGVIKIIGSMPVEQAVQGVVAIGALLVLIAGFMKAIDTINMSAKNIAGLLVMSVGLIALAGAVKIIGSMPLENIAKGLIGLAIGLGIILGAAAIASLGPVSAGLLILAGAIALIGAGALMAGVGLTAFAVGLGMLVAIGGAGIAVLTAGLLALIGLIPTFMTALGEGLVEFITSFVTTLATNQTTILTSFAQLLLGLLDTIIKYLPQFVQKGGEIIVGFLQGIADNMQDITEAGMEIIVNFLNGVAEKADDLVEAGINVIISVLNGMSENVDDLIDAGAELIISVLQGISESMQDIIDAGFEVVIEFINGLSDTIDERTAELEEAGKNLLNSVLNAMSNIYNDLAEIGRDALRGFIHGLWDSTLLGQIFNAGANAAGELIAGGKSKKGADVNSPSRKTRKIGHSVGEGYILGIKDYYSKIESAGATMGQKSVAALQSAISTVSDIIDSDMSLSPTITPVLDLSDVINGASTINNMLNGQTFGVSGNISAINTLMTQRQSRNNGSDVVDAVDRLRHSIEENPSVINNIGDVTYNRDSDINNAVNELVHALKVGRRV